MERSERGDTLIELLAAIVILGVTFAAILGGLATSALASGTHRKQADGDILLRSWAEAVEHAPYSQSCSVAGSYSFSALGLKPLLPPATAPNKAEFTLQDMRGGASITGVSDTTPFAGWLTPNRKRCSSAVLQKITLTVVSADGRDTETVDVVKMKMAP
ncbi:MAG TPA: prepilin-type N-terminal cleavage/methylation domain-containing protein [Acidimicrobiales bacterium]|nr:prepilin-type N-terminal cleavage/methylation domain-containing protein [Acidimicrobiales bacterium]